MYLAGRDWPWPQHTGVYLHQRSNVAKLQSDAKIQLYSADGLMD